MVRETFTLQSANGKKTKNTRGVKRKHVNAVGRTSRVAQQKVKRKGNSGKGAGNALDAGTPVKLDPGPGEEKTIPENQWGDPWETLTKENAGFLRDYAMERKVRLAGTRKREAKSITLCLGLFLIVIKWKRKRSENKRNDSCSKISAGRRPKKERTRRGEGEDHQGAWVHFSNFTEDFGGEHEREGMTTVKGTRQQ